MRAFKTTAAAGAAAAVLGLGFAATAASASSSAPAPQAPAVVYQCSFHNAPVPVLAYPLTAEFGRGDATSPAAIMYAP